MHSRYLAIKNREVKSLQDLFNDITSEEITDLSLKLTKDDLDYLFSDSFEFHEEAYEILINLPPLKFAAEQAEALKDKKIGVSPLESELERDFMVLS